MNVPRSVICASALVAFALCGCDDGPGAAQRLGVTSGFFTRLAPTDVYCELSDIGATAMQLSMTFGPDKKVVTVGFAPTTHKRERVQAAATLQYQAGESVGGAVEFERQSAILDPRLSESSKERSRELRTSLYFPLFVHRLVIEPATLCSDLDPGDCLEVAPSTMEDGRFWCKVSVTSPPEFSD
jgi:hypothetical protein